jgi:phosphoglycerate kinase
MIYTFYKAQGLSVGKSLVEEDKLELATSLIEKAKAKGVSLLLPTDIVVADKFAPDAESKVCSFTQTPPSWYFFLTLEQVVGTVLVIIL